MSRRQSSERTYTSAKERADKQSTGFTSPYLKMPDKVQLFKPKAGVMLLDIIPFVAGVGNPWAEEGNTHWERTFHAHRSIGANNDSYLCPRMTAKEPCPVCEHRIKLMKSTDGDEDKEAMVKDMAPKQRQLFNVVNRKDPDKGIQLWDFSYHMFGKVLDARLRNSDEEDGWANFFHIAGGFTLKVGFVERSFGGIAFFEAETIDFKPREDLDDDVVDAALCLDDLLVLEEYDALKTIYLQTGEEGGVSHKSKRPVDDDEPPRKSKRPVDDDDAPPARSRKPAEDDDAPPRRRPPVDDDEPPARSAKKPVPPTDDWDDFDEPPKKSKRPVDDDEPPRKSKRPVDDDEPPRKSKRPVDDDEPPAKPRKRFEDDDEPPRIRSADDDEPPRKSKRPVDDDEPPAKPAKKPTPKDDWDD